MIKISKRLALLGLAASAAIGASLQANALTQSMALEVATRQANESAGMLITAIDNITRQFNEIHSIEAGVASLPEGSSIEALSYNSSGVIKVKFKSFGVSGPLSGVVLKFKPKNDDGKDLMPEKDTSIHAWECLFTPSLDAQMQQMQVAHNIFAGANFPLQSCEPDSTSSKPTFNNPFDQNFDNPFK